MSQLKVRSGSLSSVTPSDSYEMKHQYSMLKLTQGLSNISRSGAKRAIMELLSQPSAIHPSSSVDVVVDEQIPTDDSKSLLLASPLKKRRLSSTDKEDYSDNEITVQEKLLSPASNTNAHTNQNKYQEKNKKIREGKMGINVLLDVDVLCGRGSGTNAHPGNKYFRNKINMYRRAYLKTRKNDKPTISRFIVQSIHERNGRFLKKDEKSGLYFEIGDDIAREKTSQALRQRASQFRQVLIHNDDDSSTRTIPDPHDLISLRRFLMQSGSSNTSSYYSSETPQNLKVNLPPRQNHHHNQQPHGAHLSLYQLNSVLHKNSLLLNQLDVYSNNQQSYSESFPLSLAPNNNSNNDSFFFNRSMNKNAMMNLNAASLVNHLSDSVVKKNMLMQHLMASIPTALDLNPQLSYLQQQIPLWTTANLLDRGRNSMTPRGA
eukprot:CAMPEP_0197822880 /NCGR_PEP_ID=MMETSP1437-20131217/178_1 /TAXON_ID=49252 ORGANISM="Eucampia antarctica, Strain CCMP1452" /NCGR_SAMPLE_ID=MMETSP1437 /ASSEMBLY_ACC=CAM_ASM_001096 /LENGTH=431 /DNA_ID=CAMNT_0043421739 /DNA_START=150 /DNA_END=1445 /DNA_ORIENTATION=-